MLENFASLKHCGLLTFYDIRDFCRFLILCFIKISQKGATLQMFFLSLVQKSLTNLDSAALWL